MGQGLCVVDYSQELYRATVAGDAARVHEVLLRTETNVNVQDASGRTCLAIATQKGFAPIVRMLIDGRASDRIPDQTGALPIHRACERGSVECLDALILNGATLNAETLDGTTPLHFASHFGYVDCVRHLVDSGAYIDSPDRDGDTPLTVAALQGQSGVVGLLLKKGASCPFDNANGNTPLHRALRARQMESIQTMVDFAPYMLEQRDADGSTLLHLAAAAGDSSTCKYLLDRGVDLLCEDIHGRTALFQAACSCNKATADLLIDRGSDWAHRDNDGKTPLEYLIMMEQNPAARYTTNVATMSDFDLTRTRLTGASAQGLCVDLIKRLETQKIMNMLMDMSHQSELLLTQTRMQEQHLTHLEQLQQYDLDNERLRSEVVDCQARIKKLKETATGRTISALATELALARTKVISR